MLTNWATIKTRVDRLKELERMQETGALALRPKKEESVLRREMEKLQKYLGGIKTMRRIPDVVVIIDVKREYNAVQECQKLGLPIVSMLDTNCDPNVVDVPIPGNDDAIRSIKLILGRLADAIFEGSNGQGSRGSGAEAGDDIYADYEPPAADYDYDAGAVPDASEAAPEAATESAS